MTPSVGVSLSIGGVKWVQCVSCGRRRLGELDPRAARCEIPGCDKTIEPDTERDPDDGEE